jgi:hypothetical protein
MKYYNDVRTHLSLAKDTPFRAASSGLDKFVAPADNHTQKTSSFEVPLNVTFWRVAALFETSFGVSLTSSQAC